MAWTAPDYRLSASYAAGSVFCRFDGGVWGPISFAPPAPGDNQLERRADIDIGGRLLLIDLGPEARDRQAQTETLRPLCEAFGKMAPRVVRALAELLEEHASADLGAARVALSVSARAQTPSEPLIIEALTVTVSSSGMDVARSVYDRTGPHGGLADGSRLIYNDLAGRLSTQNTASYRAFCELVRSWSIEAFEKFIRGKPGLPEPKALP